MSRRPAPPLFVPSSRAAALLSGVRNDLATGGVCAAGYVRFAAEYGTVDAETLAEARRMIREHHNDE